MEVPLVGLNRGRPESIPLLVKRLRLQELPGRWVRRVEAHPDYHWLITERGHVRRQLKPGATQRAGTTLTRGGSADVSIIRIPARPFTLILSFLDLRPGELQPADLDDQDAEVGSTLVDFFLSLDVEVHEPRLLYDRIGVPRADVPVDTLARKTAADVRMALQELISQWGAEDIQMDAEVRLRIAEELLPNLRSHLRQMGVEVTPPPTLTAFCLARDSTGFASGPIDQWDLNRPWPEREARRAAEELCRGGFIDDEERKRVLSVAEASPQGDRERAHQILLRGLHSLGVLEDVRSRAQEPRRPETRGNAGRGEPPVEEKLRAALALELERALQDITEVRRHLRQQAPREHYLVFAECLMEATPFAKSVREFTPPRGASEEHMEEWLKLLVVLLDRAKEFLPRAQGLQSLSAEDLPPGIHELRGWFQDLRQSFIQGRQIFEGINF